MEYVVAKATKAPFTGLWLVYSPTVSDENVISSHVTESQAHSAVKRYTEADARRKRA